MHNNYHPCHGTLKMKDQSATIIKVLIWAEKSASKISPPPLTLFFGLFKDLCVCVYIRVCWGEGDKNVFYVK